MDTETEFDRKVLTSILHLSADGDDLEPSDLSSVQDAANGRVAIEEQNHLNEILVALKKGEYQRLGDSAFGYQGINWTKNGFIKYKGVGLDHIPRESPKAESRIKSIYDICKNLEASGIPINSHTAVWASQWYTELDESNSYFDQFIITRDLYENPESGELLIKGNDVVAIGLGTNWKTTHVTDENREDFSYHGLRALGYNMVNAGQQNSAGIILASMEGIESIFQKYKVPSWLASVMSSTARTGNELDESYLACCVREPRGEFGLEGFARNDSYRIEIMSKDKDDRPYARAYDESGCYSTCSIISCNQIFQKPENLQDKKTISTPSMRR